MTVYGSTADKKQGPSVHLHLHIDDDSHEVQQACEMRRVQVESVLPGLFNSLQCTISLCRIVVSHMHMHICTH